MAHAWILEIDVARLMLAFNLASIIRDAIGQQFRYSGRAADVAARATVDPFQKPAALMRLLSRLCRWACMGGCRFRTHATGAAS
jgi:hypothetical protein